MRLILSLALVATLSAPVRAQSQWTGIGAINRTAMFMDTTTIVRSGSIRKVWIKSLDTSPRQFLAGNDTLSFDSVVGLNVFDCRKGTRAVTAVQYLLGDEVIFTVPESNTKPEALRAGSFFAAIYNDLCRPVR